jgi:hypothetical protein
MVRKIRVQTLIFYLTFNRVFCYSVFISVKNKIFYSVFTDINTFMKDKNDYIINSRRTSYR